MPSLADVLRKQVLEPLMQRIDKMSGSYEVADDDPLMVYLNGSATAVPARGFQGHTYVVGDRGDFFHRQGQPPLCIPTE